MEGECSRGRVDWLLRIAVCGAMVGHGAYGAVLAKPAWFTYFAVLGIPETTARSTSLPVIVGTAEIAVGLMLFLLPVPALLLLAAVWKIFTRATESRRRCAGLGICGTCIEHDRTTRAVVCPQPSSPTLKNRRVAGAPPHTRHKAGFRSRWASEYPRRHCVHRWRPPDRCQRERYCDSRRLRPPQPASLASLTPGTLSHWQSFIQACGWPCRRRLFHEPL
jgi:hypothetical protein